MAPPSLSTSSRGQDASLTADSCVNRQRVIYLAPDCTDSAVKKRAHGFQRAGCDLLCFSYRRDRYLVGYQPDWPNVELGKSHERRLLARVLSSLRAVRIMWAHRKEWRKATVIYARNLDLALLALLGKWITGSRAPLVYEVLDIHPTLLGHGWKGRIARWLERRVLARCRMLVVSSPAFLDEFFCPRQKFQGKAFLLENKWPPEGVFQNRPEPAAREATTDPVWTIGWFGNLRCERSLNLLMHLADTLPDRVRIYLRGYASYLGEEKLREAIAGRANVEFAGEYAAPDDLREMYSRVDFNWCADFSGGENGRWLIPNRIYEGGFFGVPALAFDDHFTGRLVRQRQLGVTISAPYEQNLVDWFGTVTVSEYNEMRRRVEQQPAGEFVDHGELRRLIQRAVSTDR